MAVELHIVQPNGSGNPIHLRHRRIDKDADLLHVLHLPRNLARRLRRDIAAAARRKDEPDVVRSRLLCRTCRCCGLHAAHLHPHTITPPIKNCCTKMESPSYSSFTC